MDKVTFFAYVPRALFRALRAAGIQPAASIKPSELDGDAYGLCFAILTSLWLRRTGAPSWEQIYDAWEQQAGSMEEPDPALYGQFQPGDRFELLTDNHDAFVER